MHRIKRGRTISDIKRRSRGIEGTFSPVLNRCRMQNLSERQTKGYMLLPARGWWSVQICTLKYGPADPYHCLTESLSLFNSFLQPNWLWQITPVTTYDLWHAHKKNWVGYWKEIMLKMLSRSWELQEMLYCRCALTKRVRIKTKTQVHNCSAQIWQGNTR